jgi:hypothetical protein
MILIKENKIVQCNEKDKQIYLNQGYKVVNVKEKPAKKDGEKADNKPKNDEGKKLEGDLENL